MSSKVLRAKQIARAEALKAPYKLHFINADPVIRRARVLHRNVEKGVTYEFEVNEDMFDFVEEMFEAPDEAELSGLTVVYTD